MWEHQDDVWDHQEDVFTTQDDVLLNHQINNFKISRVNLKQFQPI